MDVGDPGARQRPGEGFTREVWKTPRAGKHPHIGETLDLVPLEQVEEIGKRVRRVAYGVEVP